MSKPWKTLLVVAVLAAGFWFFLHGKPEGAPFVPAEEPSRPESQVAAPAQLAPIRGHVTSESGSYAQTLLVLLTPDARPRDVRGAQVAWSNEAGAQNGSFEFPSLLPGNYALELRPDDLVGLEPRTLVVQPSQQPLEFVVQDSGARTDLRVSVVADEDGSALRAFRLNAIVRGGQEHTTVVLKTGETDAVLRATPLGATLDLRVEMQGRQMLWTSVVVAERPEPLVLRLKSGWGAEFSVLGPQLEALGGALVYLDDEFAGLTDVLEGVLRVALPRVPQRCRVEYRGWKLAPGGDVSPETGQFRTWKGSIQVRMEPGK